MEATQLPKGQSSEQPGDGRKRNEPGVYEHPGAKVRVITQPGDEGVIQADAAVRVGYKRVADVPSRLELLEMRKAQLLKDKAEAVTMKTDEDKLVAEIATLSAKPEKVKA